jgi:YbbR domain-containing protein
VLLKLLKTKFPLFALSLLLSFMFWLMVSASGTSTREIPVALEVILPDEKVAVLGQPFPERITLRVEANTAQFKLIENRNLIFSVDLSKEEPGSKVLRFNLEEVLGVLQLPRGVNVSRVQPAEIPYQLYGFITKLVPVDMSLTDNYNENLVVSGPVKIEPTEVQVTGPSNVMEHVNSVPVIVSRASVTPGVKLEVKPNLSSFGSNVEVDPKAVFMASSDVSWKRNNVTVTVPVTVNVDQSSASLENSTVLASDYTLTTNPDAVAVTLSWPANHPTPEPNGSGGLKAVTTVDLKELERLGGMRLSLDVELPYDDLDILRINPNRVYVTYKRLPAPQAAPQSPSEAPGNLSPTSSPPSVPAPNAAEDLATSQENSD